MKKTPEKPLRVAAVGLGWVTTHRHLKAIGRTPSMRLVGVVDRRPGRAAALASKLRVAHAEEADLTSVSWMKNVDAVTIGACPQAHYKLIREALELGKHVLTEKPFAMTTSEGEELVQLAQLKGLVLAIVHNFQFATSAQKLLRDMEAGSLGNIRSISAIQLSNPKRRLPTWYGSLPFGLFYDESPHLLYLMRRVAGDSMRLTQCHAHWTVKNGATPCLLDAYFECGPSDNTIPIKLSMNFESPVSEWHLFVHGEDRLGIVDLFRDIYIRLPNDGAHTTHSVVLTSITSTLQHWGQHFSRGLQHLSGRLLYGNEVVFERFANAVATGSSPEHINSEDALAILKLQHEIMQLAQARRAMPSDTADLSKSATALRPDGAYLQLEYPVESNSEPR